MPHRKKGKKLTQVSKKCYHFTSTAEQLYLHLIAEKGLCLLFYNSYIIHIYHFQELLCVFHWNRDGSLSSHCLFPLNSVSLFMWLKSLFQYIRFRPSENHYNPQTQGDWSSLRDLSVTWHQGKRHTAERAIKQDGLFNLLTINKIHHHNSSGGTWRCEHETQSAVWSFLMSALN